MLKCEVTLSLKVKYNKFDSYKIRGRLTDHASNLASVLTPARAKQKTNERR